MMTGNQMRALGLALLLSWSVVSIQQKEVPSDTTEAPPNQEDEETEGAPPETEPQRPRRRAGLLPLSLVAEIDLGSRPVGPALVHEDSLIIATGQGELLSLDAATLDTRWKLGMPGAELLPPCLLPNGVLVASRSGSLTLVQPETGDIVKEFSVRSPIATAPICNGTAVFVSTPDSVVMAYDAEKWEETWQTKLQSAPIAMSVGAQLLLVADNAAGLNALDTVTGALRWQFQGRGNFEAPAVFDKAQERLYIGDTGGFFYALSLRDGTVRYRWANGAAIANAALLEEDRLFVVSYANTLFCYRTANGHELWRTNLPGRPASGPVHVRRRIVVLTQNGRVGEYLAGGQPAPLAYDAPDDVLPYPTFLPSGMVLPLRSGKLLLLHTSQPAPSERAEPGEPDESTEGEEEGDEERLAPDDVIPF
jgi:outer membrane protein assembly factor BamB